MSALEEVVVTVMDAFRPLDKDVGGSSVHVFGNLAPAAFVPTPSCCEVPPALALAVRSLAEAHADSSTDILPNAASQTADFAKLQAFVSLVGRQADDEDEPPASPLYDPLGF